MNNDDIIVKGFENGKVIDINVGTNTGKEKKVDINEYNTIIKVKGFKDDYMLNNNKIINKEID